MCCQQETHFKFKTESKKIRNKDIYTMERVNIREMAWLY